MADWSQLPKDLLHEILTHLNSPIYTLRLRSICSNWRHAITSNGHNQTPPSLSLSKRSILLLSLPPTSNSAKPSSWIIKIEEINPKSFNLFRPLSKIRVNPLPDCFPRVLDLLNIRIYDLGVEYLINSADVLGDCSLYTEKIAFLPDKNGGGIDFLLLAIHVSGKLAMFNYVDMKWTFVDRFQSPYEDLIAFSGEFYAVDNDGRTVVLSGDNNVSVVAEPGFWGDKKRLVELCGELLLVDVHIGFAPHEDGDDHGHWEVGDFCGVSLYRNGFRDDDNDGHLEFLMSRSMWFKVYRLDREGMKWVEVKDLGNYVLFLGANSTFAASADELSWDKGNYICFNFAELYSLSLEAEDDHVFKYNSDAVYDMEDSSVCSSTLFWPPPTWIASTS